MHCGQVLARPAAGPGNALTAAPVSNAETKKKAWIFALIGALAVLALFGGLFASGALRFGARQEPTAVLQTTGKAAPPALAVTGKAPPPQLQAQGKKIYMPDDVRAWLEHLERIEKRRMDMSHEQVAKAMEMLVALQAGGTMEMLNGLLEEAAGGEEVKTPGPVKETMGAAQSIRDKWQRLTADFNSVQPPAECVPVRNEYDVTLRETGAMIGDIIGAVEGATDNRESALASLMKMRGKSSGIDKSAIKTDDLVQGICDKYETRKWFKVTADVGGGLLSRGGF